MKPNVRTAFNARFFPIHCLFNPINCPTQSLPSFSLPSLLFLQPQWLDPQKLVSLFMHFSPSMSISHQHKKNFPPKQTTKSYLTGRDKLQRLEGSLQVRCVALQVEEGTGDRGLQLGGVLPRWRVVGDLVDSSHDCRRATDSLAVLLEKGRERRGGGGGGEAASLSSEGWSKDRMSDKGNLRF